MADDRKDDDVTKLIILVLGLGTMIFAYLIFKERNNSAVQLPITQPVTQLSSQPAILYSTYPQDSNSNSNQEYILKLNKIEEKMQNLESKINNNNIRTSQSPIKKIVKPLQQIKDEDKYRRILYNMM